MHDRIKKIVSVMKEKDVDFLAVFDPSNLFYFSGTSDALLLLVSTKYPPVLYTLYAFGDTFALSQSWIKEIVVLRNEYSSSGLEKPHSLESTLKNALKSFEVEGRLGLIFNKTNAELMNSIKSEFPKLSLVDFSKEVTDMRSIKDEDELNKISKAVEITEKSLEYFFSEIREDMSEKEAVALISKALWENGCDGLAFDVIVASGSNGFNAHHHPTERKIKRGELVIIDVGAKYMGYCSDLTRTFSIGTPNEKSLKIFNIVLKAQKAAISAFKPGEPAYTPDRAARSVIESAGYGEHFIHRTGHSFGIDVHEPPSLSPASNTPLKEGQVFTVEPGIYIKNWGGVRVEDDIVVTSKGAKLFSRPQESLIIL